MAKKNATPIPAVSVSYKKEFLSLMNELSIINRETLLEKTEDGTKLFAFRSSPDRIATYRLSANADSFKFDGDKIAFYNFNEFYNLFNCFESPNLEQSANKLHISSERSHINYVVSDPDTLKKGPKSLIFPSVEASFELSSAEIKNLGKMIALLKTPKAKLCYTGSECTIELCNEGHDNSFSRSYTATKNRESDIETTISSDIFGVLPTGDYTVDIYINDRNSHFVRFTMKSDVYALEIFTAEVGNK